MSCGLDVDIIMAETSFKATPINAVPIVPSALSKNLSGPVSLSEIQGEPKTGYVFLYKVSIEPAIMIMFYALTIRARVLVNVKYIFKICMIFVVLYQVPNHGPDKKTLACSGIRSKSSNTSLNRNVSYFIPRYTRNYDYCCKLNVEF